MRWTHQWTITCLNANSKLENIILSQRKINHPPSPHFYFIFTHGYRCFHDSLQFPSGIKLRLKDEGTRLKILNKPRSRTTSKTLTFTFSPITRVVAGAGCLWSPLRPNTANLGFGKPVTLRDHHQRKLAQNIYVFLSHECIRHMLRRSEKDRLRNPFPLSTFHEMWNRAALTMGVSSDFLVNSLM